MTSSVVTIQRLPEPTASKTKRRSLGNIAAILTTSPFSPSPSQRLNPSSSPPKPQRSLIGPSSVSGSNLITSFNQSLGIGVGGNNTGNGSNNNNNNGTGNGIFNLAPPPLESNTAK
jgi:hypothetical protein